MIRQKFSILLIVMPLVMLQGLLFAQSASTGKIIGQVLDAETGDPLPGANVLLKGTTIGAATDVEGNYILINVPTGSYTIVVSYIGYDSGEQFVVVGGNSTSTKDFNLTVSKLTGSVSTYQYGNIYNAILNSIALLAIALIFLGIFTQHILKPLLTITIARILLALSFGIYGIVTILDYGFGLALAPDWLGSIFTFHIYSIIGLMIGVFFLTFSLSFFIRKRIKETAFLRAGMLILVSLITILSALIEEDFSMYVIKISLTNFILAGGTLAYAGVYSKMAPDASITLPKTTIISEKTDDRFLGRSLIIHSIGVLLLILIPIYAYYTGSEFIEDIVREPEDFVWLYIPYMLVCLVLAIWGILIANRSSKLDIKPGLAVGWLSFILHFQAVINSLLLLTDTISDFDSGASIFLGILVFLIAICFIFLSTFTYLKSIKTKLTELLENNTGLVRSLLKIHLAFIFLIILFSLLSQPVLFDTKWLLIITGILFSASGAVLGSIFVQTGYKRGKWVGIFAATMVLIFFSGGLSGTVVDIDNSEPLPGVNVIVKDTHIGMATDIDGRYSIMFVPIGYYPVEANYIGYKSDRKRILSLPLWITMAGDFKLESTSISSDIEVTSSSVLPMFFPCTVVFLIYGIFVMRNHKEMLLQLTNSVKIIEE